MALLKKTKGLMDVIRCDEPSYLIWKWHPSGTQLGANDRENAIRWRSSLRVKDGEVAVFVYKHFHLQDPNYGYSAATSVLLFIITGVLGILIFRFNNTSEERAAAKQHRKKSKNSKLL